MESKTMNLTPNRAKALEYGYELYTDPKKSEAAAEIDAAVMKAAALVSTKIGEGMKVPDAVAACLTEVVRPVLRKWEDLGSGDTEPEWHVVDVMSEAVENLLGIHVDAGWDLRGSL